MACPSGEKDPAGEKDLRPGRRADRTTGAGACTVLAAEVAWRLPGEAGERLASALVPGVGGGLAQTAPDPLAPEPAASEPAAPQASGDAPLEVLLDARGGRCRILVRARERAEVLRARVRVALDLAGFDRLYLNGYNSWTDSVERSPQDAMVGLARTPRAVVAHWVLDASGDYRFAPQDPRPGHQHGIGYGYARKGDVVTLFGECAPDEGVTTILEDLPQGTLTFEKEGAGEVAPSSRQGSGEVGAGARQGGWTCVLGLFFATGTLEDAFSRYLSAMGVSRRPARPLVGFSSWYRHYGDIDAEKILHDLAGVSAILADGGAAAGASFSPVVPVFQIDDGYARVGDWATPDPARFPGGMGAMAEAIHAAGLMPGLWMAPFVCERDSRLFSEHPGWLLRDDSGRPVMSGSHWSGGYALDTLNPEVREHVRASLRMATETWGFRLLKLDFLYAAALLPHGGMNRGQLMADALGLLRASVPEGTLFDLCGVPLMSAMGRCEYCRVGCDVGLDWDGRRYMRITGRERVSTRNSLANTRGRAHLDGRAFLNDPDVFFLRDDVRLTADQRRELLLTDARLAGMLLTSDDMGAWDAGQRAAFGRALSDLEARAARYSVWPGEIVETRGKK
ncbi:glycoside hydrolase family 36 protein [Atopobiaceae bacterium HCP3S3_F7]